MASSMRLIGVLLAVTVVTAPAGASDERSGVAVHRVPNSIDVTGEADVTGELQSFLDGVPDGSVVELVPDARYRVEGTLGLVDRANLTIDGNGATLFATEEDRGPHWLVQRGDHITIRDLIQRGANPHAGLDDRAYQEARVGQHGFRLEGVRGFELDGVGVTDVYGDFVYVGRTEDETFTEGVWIHDSFFARNGRQGIAVTAGRDVVIERNVITRVRRATVDLEPNTPSWGAENIHIRNNRIGPGRLLFVAAHGDGPVNNVVIADNELSDKLLRVNIRARDGERRRNVFVTGNRTDLEATRTPLKFTRIDGVVVRDNHQEVTRDHEAAVRATNVCGLVVEGNDFGERTLRREGDPCGTAPEQLPASPQLADRMTGPDIGSTPEPPPPGEAQGPRGGEVPPAPGAAGDSDDGAALWPWLVGAAGAATLVLVAGLGYRLGARRS